MRSYTQAAEYPGHKTDRPLTGRSTRLIRDGENIAVRYHHTNVVTFRPDGSIVLKPAMLAHVQAHGWPTVDPQE